MIKFIFYIMILLTPTVLTAGTYTTTSDGLWSNDLIWSSAPSANDCSPSGNHTFNIEDSVYVLCPTGFNVSGNIDINVKNGGVLYIDANGGVTGNVDLTVETGGRVIVTGDWSSGGNSDVIVNGYFEVHGVATGSGSYTFDCNGGTNGGETVLYNGSCDVCSDGTAGCTTTLPVEFALFKVSKQVSGVELTWMTASEENNDFFTIQRSQDGMAWEDIQLVEGAGNSADLKTYTEIDNNPYSGDNYYRILQTDFDGKSSSSEIRFISSDEAFDFITEIYPNPVSLGESIHLKLVGVQGNDRVQYYVYDVAGQLLMNKIHDIDASNEVSNSFQIAHSFSPGSYIVKAINGDQVSTSRLVVR